MSKESENKAIVARWLEKLWGNPADLSVVDELVRRTSSSTIRCTG